jgi:hypothetical protein
MHVVSAVPPVPNPFDDNAQRLVRAEANTDASGRYWRWVLIAGVGVLAAWGVLIVLGLPGTGLFLVPIGVFMILGSGIQLLVNR